jgi:hypothetical protein
MFRIGCSEHGFEMRVGGLDGRDLRTRLEQFGHEGFEQGPQELPQGCEDGAHGVAAAGLAVTHLSIALPIRPLMKSFPRSFA